MKTRVVIVFGRTLHIHFRLMNGRVFLLANNPFSSSKNSHFQDEAKCTTFLMKTSFICIRIKIIFRSIASHLASLSNRDLSQLGNGLILFPFPPLPVPARRHDARFGLVLTKKGSTRNRATLSLLINDEEASLSNKLH